MGEVRDIVVKLFYSGAWQPADTYTRDRITLRRGLADEQLEPKPGVAALTLDNRDGSKNPNNPTSPLYGLVGRNTPLRVEVDGSVRIACEAADWALGRSIQPVDTVKQRGDAWTKVTGAGILRRLGRGKKEPLSSTYRVHAYRYPYIPVAYWPHEDGSQATQVASALTDAAPAAVNGDLRFAADSALIGSKPLPTMSAASSIRGTVPAYTAPATQEWTVEWITRVPAPPAGVTELISIETPASTVKRWALELVPQGGLDLVRLRGYSGTGAEIIGDTGVNFQTADGSTEPYGLQLAMFLHAVQNGTAVDWDFQYTLSGGGAGKVGSIAACALNNVAAWEFRAQAGMAGVTVGHVAVYPLGTAFGDQTFVEAHAGEIADARIGRLCNEEGVPITLVGGFNGVEMGPQPTATFTELLYECVRTDAGLLYELRDAAELKYRVGRGVCNRDPALTLNYAGGEVAPTLEPIIGDQGTRNDVIAKRASGSSARAILSTGRMSIQDPPDGVGRYDTTLDVNPLLDSRLIDHATWHLWKSTVDETRYRTVRVDLDATPHLTAAANAVDIGDRILVANLPDEDSYDDAILLVIAIEETLRDRCSGRMLTFTTLPASPYEVGVVGADDGSTNLRGQAVDTDKSTLTAGIPAVPPGTSSTFTVTSTDGVVWTTDANDWDVARNGTSLLGAGLFIRVGGEDMRVTNIAGAASPQTFTVLRGQNGVVKAHSAGAPVHVRFPVVIGL